MTSPSNVQIVRRHLVFKNNLKGTEEKFMRNSESRARYVAARKVTLDERVSGVMF